MRRLALPALALALAACSPGYQPVSGPYYAVDGDTIYAGNDANLRKLRLTTIDAPELPGHCRPGRACVSGDPYAAKAALQSLLGEQDGQLWCHRLDTDVYHREIVDCYVHHPDGDVYLSQAMLNTGLVGRYQRN